MCVLSGRFLQKEAEDAIGFAVRTGAELDETIVAIQGPPGSGKTFCGAKMICELVAQGKKVGITANSHTVIRNLLDKVVEDADKTGLAVLPAHRCDETPDCAQPRVRPLATNPEVLAALQAGGANVVGGTAWLWARALAASCE